MKLAPDDRVAKAKANPWQRFLDRCRQARPFPRRAGDLGVVSNYTDSATAGVLSACGISAAGELIDAARNGWNSRHVSARGFAVGCLGGVAAGFAGVYIAPDRIVWSREF